MGWLALLACAASTGLAADGSAGASGAEPAAKSGAEPAAEDPFVPLQVGRRVTWFGALHDTSEINLFQAHFFRDGRSGTRRFYVQDRVYRQPHQSVWATVDAVVAQVDAQHDDRHVLRIEAFRGLTADEVAAVARGMAAAQQRTAAYLATVDMNDYKRQHRRPVFVAAANWDRDFRKLPQRALFEIRSLNVPQQRAIYACRRYVVEEVPHHHAAYIDVVVQVELSEGRPLQIVLERGGYFLE